MTNSGLSILKLSVQQMAKSVLGTLRTTVIPAENLITLAYEARVKIREQDREGRSLVIGTLSSKGELSLTLIRCGSAKEPPKGA